MASSSGRWRQVEALFYEALELEPEARSEFLGNALQRRCGVTKRDRSSSGVRRQTHRLPAPARGRSGASDDGGRSAVRSRRRTVGPLRNHFLARSRRHGRGLRCRGHSAQTQGCLKMLVPELTRDERNLRRFEQEARAASALNHPNILTIYEFGQSDGLCFIASEFIEGATLRQQMANGRLEWNATIDIAIQIASALSAAHACWNCSSRHQARQRDCEERTELLKVLDFGIAKLSESRVGAPIRRRSSSLASSNSEPGMNHGHSQIHVSGAGAGKHRWTHEAIFSAWDR